MLVRSKRIPDSVLFRTGFVTVWLVQLSVFHFNMVSTWSEEPIRALSRRSEVCLVLPVKQLQCWSNGRRSLFVLSRKIVEHFLFLCLSPPGDRWCDLLSKASQHFRPSKIQAIFDAYLTRQPICGLSINYRSK